MESSNKKVRKRKTVKPKVCPNPLFEKWLLEWKNEADKRDSKLKFIYSKALTTLRKYPLPLKNGKECLILKYFGAQLCDRLDRKLEEYKETHSELTQITSVRLIETIQEVISNPVNKKNCNNSPAQIPKLKKMNKSYVPAFRSGAYALLLALFEEQKRLDYPGYMLKQELQEKAQPFCSISLSKPEPGSYYTGWSSMATLKSKGLVTQSGKPSKYSLTEEGEELAKKLSNYNPADANNNEKNNIQSSQSTTSADVKPKENISKNDKKSDLKRKGNIKSEFDGNQNLISKEKPQTSLNKYNDIDSTLPSTKILLDSQDYTTTVANYAEETYKSESFRTQTSSVEYSQSSSQQTSTSVDDLDCEEQLIFLPNSFQVILLIDTGEITGYAELDKDALIKELKALKVNYEVRHLNVGDFVWICRDDNGKELVLPYVVERKRLDDVGNSIKDGRFHEQKFRLKQCGLQNVIYLVEKYRTVGLPLSTLQQAVVNTQVVDEFYVKFTDNYHETINYLASMTTLLTKTYSIKMLLSCPKNNLPELNINDDSASLMTYSEVQRYSAKKSKNFKVGEMFIKQLIQLRGLTVEKAIAIVNHYPTPRHLISAYRRTEQGEMLLSDIKYGSPVKRIGPHISSVLHELYTKTKLT